MMKELTEAECRQLAERPKRRFQTLARSGVSLHEPMSTPSYWFEWDELALGTETGTFRRDPNQATISRMVDGKVSVLFYLVGRRLDSCTFAHHLTPTDLHRVVTAMRRGKLQKLIRSAAEWSLRAMPVERRPMLEGALRDLLRSIDAQEHGPAKQHRVQSSTPHPKQRRSL